MLPVEVLEETQSELVNYKNSGMSLIECSHRGPHYDEVHNEAVGLVKELLRVPDEFGILFLQGGSDIAVRNDSHEFTRTFAKGSHCT